MSSFCATPSFRIDDLLNSAQVNCSTNNRVGVDNQLLNSFAAICSNYAVQNQLQLANVSSDKLARVLSPTMAANNCVLDEQHPAFWTPLTAHLIAAAQQSAANAAALIAPLSADSSVANAAPLLVPPNGEFLCGVQITRKNGVFSI